MPVQPSSEKRASGKPVTVQDLIGKFDSPEHKKWVEEVLSRHKWLVEQCTPFWQNTTRYWRLYLAKVDELDRDLRGSHSRASVFEDERWRSKAFVPRPYSGVETAAAQETDIMLGSDPPITASPVGDEDYEGSRAVERLLEYSLRKNTWRKKLYGANKVAAIQGMQPYKLGWVNRSYEFAQLPPKQKDYDYFKSKLAESIQALNMDPSTIPSFAGDPTAFEQWRKLVNETGKVSVPEVPQGGPTTINLYRGPVVEFPRIYTVRFDPLIDEVADQPLFVHRMTQSGDYVRRMVKKGLWDKVAVEEALKRGMSGDASGGSGGGKLTTEEEALNAMLDIPSTSKGNPTIQDTHEILECWQVNSATVKYAVILNQVAVVNVSPELPFMTGAAPFGFIRNVYVPGLAFGIGEIQQPEQLYHELNIMRRLRIMRTMMETLPAFAKLGEWGIPDMKRRLVPGALIPQQRPGSLEQLIKYQPTSAFQDLNMIEADIDDANGVGGNVKGTQAIINRVSASESEGRAERAMTRLKMKCVVKEEDLAALPFTWIALWAQKGDAENKLRIGGMDPFLSVDREQLLEALEQDFQFRGATRALGKDMQVQEILNALKMGANVLAPPEIRNFLKRALEIGGIKGLAKLLQQPVDQFFQKKWEGDMQVQTLTQQAQVGQLMAQLNPPPPTVDAEGAQDLERPDKGPAEPTPPGTPPAPTPQGLS